MMEAASTSETSVNFYKATRRNVPEDSHLRTQRMCYSVCPHARFQPDVLLRLSARMFPTRHVLPRLSARMFPTRHVLLRLSARMFPTRHVLLCLSARMFPTRHVLLRLSTRMFPTRHVFSVCPHACFLSESGERFLCIWLYSWVI
jgi:hypothetical protein